MTDDLTPNQQVDADDLQDRQPASPQSSDVVEQSAKAQRPARGWLAWLALLLCIGAWVALHFDGKLSAGLCTAALIASIVGLRQRSRAAHNLALTTLVASAVLALVLAIVAIALYMLTKS